MEEVTVTDAPDLARRTAARQGGRRPSTTHAELSHIALALFVEHGFDAITLDDIAAAAGIGRRTLFRYVASKNDLPWGDFDELLVRLREQLTHMPDDRPLLDVLRVAIIEFNRVPAEEVPFHRQRMELLLNVPALAAHSTLRYAGWRHVIAEYAARRLGVAPDSLAPQAIAWAMLGVALAAYEHWLRETDADLSVLLHEGFEALRGALDVPPFSGS
jgi:mycofactocin system transcriptional regulator